ncbi:hypothetical protein TNCV_4647771 [Trichonephila clavipes]|uniref:Uncharacterized protein n=1 Tax=Trichonephila clavipes TaxID=2585209 RepID=A0A8X6SYB8_TRICX|nr:hypothetical protein TNCV_4647771 [Trichonephila clavipes]
MSENTGHFSDRGSSNGYSCNQVHCRIDGRGVNRDTESSMFLHVLMHPSEHLMIRLPPHWISFPIQPNIYSPLSVGNRDYTGMWVRLGSTDLMTGKVMFLRSNQGDRLDGNESVADSFRSDLVGFKSWSRKILGAFFPLTSARKTSSREANSLTEVTLTSLLFSSSDKYHPCKI